MLKLVEHAMGVVLKEVKVWYTIKFDRRLLLPFENDGEIRSMMRGNDGHAYLYFTAMEVPCGPPRERGEPEQVAGVCNNKAVHLVLTWWCSWLKVGGCA